MTSKVVYTGHLRSSATHILSGSVIETDAPTDNHGKGERFSPTDLVATALASCIVTTIGIGAAAHDLNIDGAVCEVTKVMASDPRRISEIIIDMSFPDSAPFTDKQKVIIERIAATCPVAASLHPDLKKTISIKWPE